MTEVFDVKKIIEEFCPFAAGCPDYSLVVCNKCNFFYNEQAVMEKLKARKDRG